MVGENSQPSAGKFQIFYTKDNTKNCFKYNTKINTKKTVTVKLCLIDQSIKPNLFIVC